MRNVGVVLGLAGLAFMFAGCMPVGEAAGSTVIGAKFGKQCTVQFRRDALGAASPCPVPPLTNSLNGAETSVSGTLTRADDDWIVIDRGTNGELLIAKSSVLLLRFSNE